MQITSSEAAIDLILERIQGPIRLGTPLGLGKPNPFLNAFYRRIKQIPSRRLEIYTALSLDLPQPKNFFESRFYGPFIERHFGADYPRLEYLIDTLEGRLPDHIRVHEFYFQAGKLSHVDQAQRDYISLNYTHAGRGIMDRGMNVLVQMVAADAHGNLSLSCNPDLTLDLADLARETGRPLLKIAVIHPDLPFLGGEAQVEASFFDAVVETPAPAHPIFAVPRMPIDPVSHLIGFHASQLVLDGGSLQIGIGSLGEGLTDSLILRNRDNGLYREIAEEFWRGRPRPDGLSWDRLNDGLYGTSEMVLDGFMHLRKAGILKRTVRDKDTRGRHYLHGAFYLGSKDFYAWLKSLQGEDRDGFAMTRVSKVNDLYDADEMAIRRQRVKARFFNTGMKMSLLGDAISDTLDDGRVVSGVGGQYNFVAMAHELPDARSVLMMKSTRTEKGKRLSNFQMAGGHLTISRHLRDVVITEYGIARLAGRSDEECVRALLEIADSEFQEALAERAKKAGKLSKNYVLPDHAKKNTPEFIRSFVGQVQEKNESVFSLFPFGSDFTDVEQSLVGAFALLKKKNPAVLAACFAKGLATETSRFTPELERMGLTRPDGVTERFYRTLLRGALAKSAPAQTRRSGTSPTRS